MSDRVAYMLSGMLLGGGEAAYEEGTDEGEEAGIGGGAIQGHSIDQIN